jgi:hypothetical protein
MGGLRELAAALGSLNEVGDSEDTHVTSAAASTFHPTSAPPTSFCSSEIPKASVSRKSVILNNPMSKYNINKTKMTMTKRNAPHSHSTSFANGAPQDYGPASYGPPETFTPDPQRVAKDQVAKLTDQNDAAKLRDHFPTGKVSMTGCPKGIDYVAPCPAGWVKTKEEFSDIDRNTLNKRPLSEQIADGLVMGGAAMGGLSGELNLYIFSG